MYASGQWIHTAFYWVFCGCLDASSYQLASQPLTLFSASALGLSWVLPALPCTSFS